MVPGVPQNITSHGKKVIAESSIDSWFSSRTRADKMVPEDVPGLQTVYENLFYNAKFCFSNLTD